MKKLNLIITLLAFLAIFTNAYTQNTNKCLELVYPDEPFNGYWNPDSVMVDTCSESPTFGKWYSKKGYEFGMSIYVFGNDTLSMDTSVTWEAISSSFTQIKNAFQNLEQEFGPYIIKRSDWQPNDSTFLETPVLLLEFQDYFEFDSVSNALGEIDSTGKARMKNIPGILYHVESSNDNFEDLFCVEFNDNSDFIRIIFNQTNEIPKMNRIIIYNLFGQQIFQQSINNKEISIDTSTWACGVYIVTIGRYSKLIII